MKRLLFVCLALLVFLQLECNNLTPAEALHGDCCPPELPQVAE